MCYAFYADENYHSNYSHQCIYSCSLKDHKIFYQSKSFHMESDIFTKKNIILAF